MSNASIDQGVLQDEEPHRLEVALLLLLAALGVVANLAVLALVAALPRLRRASNAFVCHQCLLDLLKSAYCLPFAQSLVTHTHSPVWCGLVGGSYIVLVTSSAFNQLATVMNEAYHLADLAMKNEDSRSWCCVIFGIFTIWFGSVIMNLGVAFIPGNLSFNRQREQCIFIHGITQNFVLQMLWVVLMSMATALTLMYLHKFRMDIKRVGYYRLSTLVRTTFKIDPLDNAPARQEEQRDRRHIQQVQRLMRRKFRLMLANTSIFLAFWYPLFVLSAVDWRSRVPHSVYKALTLLAWSNSSISPFILTFFIRSDTCCHDNPLEVTDAQVEEYLFEEEHRAAKHIGSREQGGQGSWTQSPQQQSD